MNKKKDNKNNHKVQAVYLDRNGNYIACTEEDAKRLLDEGIKLIRMIGFDGLFRLRRNL